MTCSFSSETPCRGGGATGSFQHLEFDMKDLLLFFSYSRGTIELNFSNRLSPDEPLVVIGKDFKEANLQIVQSYLLDILHSVGFQTDQCKTDKELVLVWLEFCDQIKSIGIEFLKDPPEVDPEGYYSKIMNGEKVRASLGLDRKTSQRLAVAWTIMEPRVPTLFRIKLFVFRTIEQTANWKELSLFSAVEPLSLRVLNRLFLTTNKFISVKRKSGFTPKMLQKFSTEGILGFEDCFEKQGLVFAFHKNSLN